MRFYAELLKLRQYNPWLRQAFHALSWLGVVVLLTPWIGHYRQVVTVVQLINVLSCIVAIRASLRLWQEGTLASRLATGGVMLTVASLLPNILGTLGIIPASPAALEWARFAELPQIIVLHIGIMLRGRELERQHKIAIERAREEAAIARQERQAR